MKRTYLSTFNPSIFQNAFRHSFSMLHPLIQWKNPVMFVTYICAIATTIYTIQEPSTNDSWGFDVQISLWLWLTVFFANFAQSIAESRGKAHAATLRRTQTESYARQIKNGIETKIAAHELKKGDTIFCEAGDIIPADGEVIHGIATIDESAITGESAPVIRESGGDRSAVTAGTKVLSDQITILVTSDIGNSFLDRMIQMVEGATRQKTPNEIALHIVLSALTLIFLLTTVSLKAFADYSNHSGSVDHGITLPILIALLVCLIPTTISALLNAVGIAGLDRLIRRNVIAKSGRSVEAAGDIDLLILDKTGTITMGNRMATDFLPAINVLEKDFATIAQLASLSDETPEGRSISVLAKTKFGLKAESLQPTNTVIIPFSAKTRMSGLDFTDSEGHIIRTIRKGSIDAIRKQIQKLGGNFPEEIEQAALSIAKKGSTPLLVSDDTKVMGIIELKDVIKGGMKERFTAMRKAGIKTVMVTGDNPLTAAAIAAEAGVDDYIAEATPEIKLELIKKEQASGRLVAMAGDGTNDAPALAQADVAVAMNAGTQASREAGNMVDLDNNPTKLLDIVEIGKQLLITRGALTTFSISNDIAKYFAIIPAIFSAFYASDPSKTGPLSLLNIMLLHSPKSAILSAVVFNALVIIALIPLALKGVQYKPQTADQLLFRNISIYGAGGVIAPFIGIKLLDLLIHWIGVA